MKKIILVSLLVFVATSCKSPEENEARPTACEGPFEFDDISGHWANNFQGANTGLSHKMLIYFGPAEEGNLDLSCRGYSGDTARTDVDFRFIEGADSVTISLKGQLKQPKGPGFQCERIRGFGGRYGLETLGKCIVLSGSDGKMYFEKGF